MKRHLLLLFLLFTSINNVTAQNCLTGNVTFSSQAQVDNFPVLYPDCIEILGNLTISGADITNLDSLYQLRSFGQSLLFYNTTSLQSFSGLDSVKTIGGDLTMYGNTSLTNLNGLNFIDSIGGGLIIDNNENLISLNGIENLNFIEGELKIISNDLLENLNGFSDSLIVSGKVTIDNNNALTSLIGFGPGCIFKGDILISRNQFLPSLIGLEFLTKVIGTLKINENYNLTSLQGLDSLNAVGDLLIEDNYNVSDLLALNNLDSVNGRLSIFNSGIANLEGLGNLKYVENNLHLNGNSSLTEVSQLTSLDSIGGFLLFDGNNSLTTINNFLNLVKVGGELSIGNPNLTELSGFPNLIEIEGELTIYNLYNINDLSAFENLQSTGGLYLSNAPDIDNLTGLENLQFITGNFKINDCPSLKNISALSNVNDVGGSLRIINCDSLLNLDGLNNLSTVNAQFKIINNDRLENVTDLNSLSYVGGGLAIDGNPLSSFVGLENLTSVGGDVFLADNTNTTINGLEGLTSIGGDLTILLNTNLTSLSGLQNLGSINGHLRIENNDLLHDINSLSNLDGNTITDLTIKNNPQLSNCDIIPICDILNSETGNFTIQDNGSTCNSQADLIENCQFQPCLNEGITFSTQTQIDSFPINHPICDVIIGDVIINGVDITSVIGLNGIREIQGNLTIGGEPSSNLLLSSISGLNSLETIRGNLKISENTTLINFIGLHNLSLIEGDVSIENNLSLVSLIGFGSIDTNEIDSLSIIGNPLLSSCDIEAVCNYINYTNSVININNNAEDCNSIEEIETQCSSSGCLVDGFTFDTQQSIDDFIINNPDCHVLEGNIYISGQDIDNLNGFANITHCMGGLIIGDYLDNGTNTNLTNLNGLNNLSFIEGDFKLLKNDSLINLDGLENLVYIGFRFEINENPKLENILGLQNLSTTNYRVEIISNPLLTSLEGLNNLTKIDNNSGFGLLYLKIINNESLENLNGLENLKRIEGDFYLKWNNSLLNFEGLSNLQTVDNSFFIEGNALLENAQGLNKLSSVGGILSFVNNLNHTSFNGLDNLINLNWLEINKSISMIEIEGLDSINHLGKLIVKLNNSLLSLDGLQNLITISGDLFIEDNHQLSNLDGLSNLTSFDGMLRIVGNNILTNLDGLNNVAPSSINDGMYIHGNPLLESCSNALICNALEGDPGFVFIVSNAFGCSTESQILDSCSIYGCFPDGLILSSQDEINQYQNEYPICTTIDGDLIISGNDITNVSGLSIITEITGSLIIENNPMLESLSSLLNLELIGGDLIINNNPILVSISELNDLDGQSIINLIVTNNDSLSECSVTSICTYLLDPNGTVTIFNNSDQCSSIEDFSNACTEMPCIGGFLELTSQEEVDNFHISYPFCDRVDGDLFIYGDGISNLDSLIYLNYVGGALYLTANTETTLLTDITGLMNLDSIGGDLRILNNTNLETLEGLNNLQKIGEQLEISNNKILSSLLPLSNLYKIDSYVKISLNDSLTTLIGLVGLDSLWSLDIGFNPVLENLSGLENLVYINHGLTINNNDELSDITSLSNLNKVESFQLKENPILNSIDLPLLTSLTNLKLDNCASIVNFNGFNALQSIDGNFDLLNMSNLTDFTGLETLQVGFNLNIINCTSLISLADMESLIQLYYLKIEGCSSLIDLSGLEGISSLAGYLELLNNDALVNLNGMSNLYGVGMNLKISGNEILNDISDLMALTYVNGEIRVEENNSLISVSGLDNIDPTSFSAFYFINNPNLSTCDIESVCAFIQNPNNYYEATGNSTSCSDSGIMDYLCNDIPCASGGLTLSSQNEIDQFTNNYPGCTVIDGDLTIANASINNLEGLQVLIGIEGNLVIGDETTANTSLSSAHGLHNIFLINGNLEVKNNDALTNLVAFTGTHYVNEDLIIDDNDILTTLFGLENLTSDSLINISITNNISLNYCNVDALCASLVTPNGTITISGNTGDCLTQVEVETACSSVGCFTENIIFSTQLEIDDFAINNPDCYIIEGDVLISGNDIDNLNGLNQLQVINGDLKIGDNLWANNNPSLIDLTGLENLTNIGGVLFVASSDSLMNFSGLNSLNFIGGGLEINNSNGIETLAGLSNVEYIGGFIWIEGTSTLLNLDPLSSVGIIAGYIRIYNNEALMNISGISQVNPSSITELQISYNPNLSECAYDNFCEYISYSYASVSIGNNAYGCNDQEQVELICNATPCLSGGLNITTQAEIDEFPALYSDCNTIQGNLSISGNDINDLTPFLQLNFLEGSLIIENTTLLSTLDGLNGIIEISGDLVLENNAALNNIESLASIYGLSIENLTITNNPLIDQCAIESICTFIDMGNGTTSVFNNGANCSTIEDIELICMGLEPPLVFSSQSEIDDFINICINCNIINGDLIIEGIDILNVDGLSSIIEVVGSVFVGGSTGNPILTNLSGLGSLTTIGENLTIENNLVLSSISGIDEEIISASIDLASLEGIGGDFGIIDNPSLTDLSGLETLTSIGGDLIINTNDILVDLNGLDNIDHVTISNLYIDNNLMLSTCHILSICNYLGDPTGELEIYSNSEGCNNEDEINTLCLVGIDEGSFEKSISIYPNPAKSVIYITSSIGSTIDEVIIYNQLGQEVKHISTNFEAIDVSDLKTGIYIIEVAIDQTKLREKLVIE